MGSSRAGALARCSQSAWQASQIVAFGIFSSYAGFAYLIAGVIHAPLFLVRFRSAPKYYFLQYIIDFLFFCKILSYLVFFGHSELSRSLLVLFIKFSLGNFRTLSVETLVFLNLT